MDKTERFQKETKQVVGPDFELAWEKKEKPAPKKKPAPAKK